MSFSCRVVLCRAMPTYVRDRTEQHTAHPRPGPIWFVEQGLTSAFRFSHWFVLVGAQPHYQGGLGPSILAFIIRMRYGPPVSQSLVTLLLCLYSWLFFSYQVSWLSQAFLALNPFALCSFLLFSSVWYFTGSFLALKPLVLEDLLIESKFSLLYCEVCLLTLTFSSFKVWHFYISKIKLLQSYFVMNSFLTWHVHVCDHSK